jgi:hypothetical protein
MNNKVTKIVKACDGGKKAYEKTNFDESVFDEVVFVSRGQWKNNPFDVYVCHKNDEHTVIVQFSKDKNDYKTIDEDIFFMFDAKVNGHVFSDNQDFCSHS